MANGNATMLASRDSYLAPPSSRAEWAQGWRAVAAGSLGFGAACVHKDVLSVVMKPLQGEFGWSRTEISMAILILVVCQLMFSPFIGQILARFGLRKVALFGVTWYGVGLAAIGLAGPSIWSWYLGWIAFSFMYVCVSPAVWTSEVARNFSRQRGLALAVTLSLGTGILTFVVPSISVAVIAEYGWRAAFVAVGALSLLITYPAVLLLLKPSTADERRAIMDNDLPGMTRTEAMRTGRFWRLTLSLFIATGVMATLSIHLMSMLTDKGLTATEAALGAGAIGPALLFGRLMFGLVLDRITGPALALIAFSFPLAACALLLGFQGGAMAGVVIGLLIGVAWGVESDLAAYMCSRYFGVRNYTQIFAMVHPIAAIGFGLGPVLAAVVFDLAGSYQLLLWGVLVALLISAGLMVSLGAYTYAADDGAAAEPDHA